MDTPGDPPPEGRLIEQAREAMPGKMSQNKAASRAGMSGTRWRQIVTGVASGGKGIRLPVHGNAETVARMAQAVGVKPEQLVEVDREDAAAQLRLLAPPDEPEPSVAELTERVERTERATARLAEENSELRRMLRELTGKNSDSSGSLEGGSDEASPRQAM